MDPHKLNQIKLLRAATNISIEKCRLALESCNYNLDDAVQYIKKHTGTISNAGRSTKEGIITTATVKNIATLVEVKSETDFVAREHAFLEFANMVAHKAAEHDITSVEHLNSLEEIQFDLKKLMLSLGENIQITRLQTIKSDILGTYIHDRKIGCLVAMDTGTPEIAHELAIHIIGYNPKAVTYNDLDPGFIKDQVDLINAQSIGLKPENVVHFIKGKIQKLKSQHTLLEQPFFRNDKYTVEKFLRDNKASIKHFIRMELS